MVSDYRRIPDSQLPPSATIGFEYDGLCVNPRDFLTWITDQLRGRGVRFTQHTISSVAELGELTGAGTLVNAAGIGAAALARDSSVHAVRGQTMFVPCDFREAFLLQGSQYTYVIPRLSDGGVILGGVSDPDDHRTEADSSIREDILKRVNVLTGGKFTWVDLERDVARDIVGFRPGRKDGLRLAREGNVLHAYGGGSLGWMYAFGVAKRICKLISGEL
jgi:D-amino-acid oxidase